MDTDSFTAFIKRDLTQTEGLHTLVFWGAIENGSRGPERQQNAALYLGTIAVPEGSSTKHLRAYIDHGGTVTSEDGSTAPNVEIIQVPLGEAVKTSGEVSLQTEGTWLHVTGSTPRVNGFAIEGGFSQVSAFNASNPGILGHNDRRTSRRARSGTTAYDGRGATTAKFNEGFNGL